MAESPKELIQSRLRPSTLAKSEAIKEQRKMDKDKEKEKRRPSTDTGIKLPKPIQPTAMPASKKDFPEKEEWKMTQENFQTMMNAISNIAQDMSTVKLEMVTKDDLDTRATEIETNMTQMTDQIKMEIQTMRGAIAKNTQDLKKMKDAGDSYKTRLDDHDNQFEQQLDKIAAMEMRERENSLRLRGLEEEAQEQIYSKISGMVAKFLETTVQEIEQNLDCVFRVNSEYARRKNVPRDVMIRFTRRIIRDEILKKHQNQPWTVAGRRLIVLKDLPARIIRKRRDYRFIVDILRKKNIPFTWDRQEGIFLFFKGGRHRLNSIDKAREFLRRYNLEGNGEEFTDQQHARSRDQRRRSREEKQPEKEEGATGATGGVPARLPSDELSDLLDPLTFGTVELTPLEQRSSRKNGVGTFSDREESSKTTKNPFDF